ncbi:MAG TPA: hypothetical protein VHL54_09955 [Actinomycetota bacterium]|nr:hypothetical protein [Actinomycetota bacterium]
MADYRSALEALRRSILDTRGSLPTEIRRRIYDAEPVDQPLSDYAARVRTESTSLTEADIESLKVQGCTEDEIFEATLAAALGAADRTLQAGLAALEGTT